MTHELQRVMSKISDGVAIPVKVVPRSKQNAITGILGDRLKVLVSVAPEADKANRMVCELLADLLGVPHRNVRIHAGQRQPRKTVHVIGRSLCDASTRLNQHLRSRNAG